MPYLNQIVDKINTDLSVNTLTDATIIKNMMGIASVVLVNDGEVSRFPAIMPEKGNGQFVLDDRKNLTVYHRCLSKTIVNDERNFGDGNDNKVKTCSMIMVVFAKKSQLKRSKDEIEDLIINGMPTELSRTWMTDYSGLNAVNIAANEINSDSIALWNQEFNGYKYQLKPDQVLFAVQYTVEIKYKQSCVSACSTC